MVAIGDSRDSGHTVLRVCRLRKKVFDEVSLNMLVWLIGKEKCNQDRISKVALSEPEGGGESV